MKSNPNQPAVPSEIAGTKADPRRTAQAGVHLRTPRCTKTEMRNRVAATIQLIAGRIPDHQIIRAIKDKYGYGRRSAQLLMARARKQMRRRSRRPTIDMVSEAREFYEKILRDPEVDLRRKLDAQYALREMFGLDKPKKIAPTNAEGDKSWKIDFSQLSDEELDMFARVEERMMGLATGKEGAARN